VGKNKKTYTPAPTIPPELTERYQVVLDVIAGKISVSDGARKLGLARNHFQTILHEGETAILAAIAPKKGGRPRKPEREAELEKELEQLRKENARLKDRVETTDRMLQLAGGLLKGTIRPTGRDPAAKARKDRAGESDDDHIRKLEAARVMRRLGLSRFLAASALGCGASTLARWEARERRGVAIARRRGPVPCAPEDAFHAPSAAALVRLSRGLLGAETIARSIGGISRRCVAAIKKATLAEIERERRAKATRVTISMPGIVRGFDAMELSTGYLLAAGDACVPYRTFASRVERYAADEVARALDEDFAKHGAPLVARLDRAKQHDAPEVRSVLDRWKVLTLHGPPRHPQYYAQLERQNREHRAWLNVCEDEFEQMLEVANRLWKRRILAWKSAEEVWLQRPQITEDRDALREEVRERAARIRHELEARGESAAQAERFAIEAALEKRGYLRRKIGGWC